MLLLAHLDTVFPAGEAARRPMSVVDGRAMGPGASDDKAGILTAIYAVKALQAVQAPLPNEVIVVLMPDEEIGSPSGRPLLEDVAAGCDVAWPWSAPARTATSSAPAAGSAMPWSPCMGGLRMPGSSRSGVCTP